MARKELDKSKDKLGELIEKSDDNFKELYQKTEEIDNISIAFDRIFHQNTTDKEGEG